MDNEKILLDALNTFGNFTSVEQEFNYNQLEVIYEAMNQVLHIAPVIRWVAVSERTPETNALCLCATEYGYSFRYWKGNHFEGEHVAKEPKVTHWMYAPDPPCI